MDLHDRSDIITLVDKFYERVKQDELLAPVFAQVHWPSHLPVMYNFWSSLLLGESGYTGNPFQKHRTLLIEARHFDQWISLFLKTVDDNFAGEKAEEIKMRAQSIARVFQHKMGLFPST